MNQTFSTITRKITDIENDVKKKVEVDMEFFTVKELCGILKLKERQIYSLINSGVLPSVRWNSKSIRVTDENLAEFAKRFETKLA